MPEPLDQAAWLGHHDDHVGIDLVGVGQEDLVDPASGGLSGGADPRRDGYAIGW